VERLDVSTRFKTIDGSNTFGGIASVFGNVVDAVPPTIIERGAFLSSLQKNPFPKILWMHDTAMPIGRCTECREGARGLEVIGKISETSQGKEALRLLRDGIIDELSIGFDPVKWEMDGEIRRIKDLKLWEISLVTFGADSGAKISEVNTNRASWERLSKRLDLAARLPAPWMPQPDRDASFRSLELQVAAALLSWDSEFLM
jgi:HK97 family phage prohead protease